MVLPFVHPGGQTLTLDFLSLNDQYCHTTVNGISSQQRAPLQTKLNVLISRFEYGHLDVPGKRFPAGVVTVQNGRDLAARHARIASPLGS